MTEPKIVVELTAEQGTLWFESIILLRDISGELWAGGLDARKRALDIDSLLERIDATLEKP